MEWLTGPSPRFGDVFEQTTMTEGNVRLVVGARRPDATLLLKLIAPWRAARYWILYVLTIPQVAAAPGRYQRTAPLDDAELAAFLRRHEALLVGDGRHALWIADADDPRRQLVYEKHDVIYLYGGPSFYLPTLRTLGFVEGSVSLDVPHAHHYHPHHDPGASAMLADGPWQRFDLRPGDDS